MLYKVGVLKNVAKFTENISDGVSFEDFEEILKNFEEHHFYKIAVDDYFWIYQNINCHKVSVSELIISKSYKEVGRRGRSKLLFHTHINHQSCTLVKGLQTYQVSLLRETHAF